MALATKCDVCGVLFEQKFIPDITIHRYTHGYGEERLDLCPDCTNKLETWLHNDVDAVPVVRCKECRYWRQKVSPTEHWVCAHHSFNERKMYTMPDFYCADGEDKA